LKSDDNFLVMPIQGNCVKDWKHCVMWWDITSPQAAPISPPKATLTKLIRSYPQTGRVADLQEQLFSLFFQDSSKYHCLQQVSVGGWSSAREFPRNGENLLQIYTPTQTIFVFLLRITALPILRPTIHSSMCCSSFVNVALTCPFFLHSATPSENLVTHGRDKQKYMWAWVWVGKWVWPVEKW